MRASYRPTILIHGAGEMASGVAHTLFSRGWTRILMTELPQPRAVRRAVCYSEAVFDGAKTIEGVGAVLIGEFGDIGPRWKEDKIPVLVDPESTIAEELKPDIFVEASMGRKHKDLKGCTIPAVVALGSGFRAPYDCHAVVETQRGENLGGVIWRGSALPDPGAPAEVMGYTHERVLKARRSGVFHTSHCIGDVVHASDILGKVHAVMEASPNDTHNTIFLDEDSPVVARIGGLVRGLMRDGTYVRHGEKLGDIDPRADFETLASISDKCRRVGEGVYEAITVMRSREKG